MVLRCKRRSSISNEWGMSLLEVLVVLGIMSIIGLVGAQLVSNMTTVQSGITADAALQDLLNELRISYRDPARCSPNIVNFSSTELTTANASLVKISVTRWALNGKDLVIDGGPIPGIYSSRVGLSIENLTDVGPNFFKGDAIFSVDRGISVGGRVRVRKIPVLIGTNTSGRINSCSFSMIDGLSDADYNLIRSEICTSMGGIYNPASGQCSIAALIKEQSCIASGGTYNVTTQSCSLLSNGVGSIGRCPTGSVANGVDSAGKITCMSMPTSTTVVTGSTGSTSTSGSSTTPIITTGSGSTTTTTSTSTTSGSTTSSSTAPKNCPGGSFTKVSPGGSNTCYYTYPGAAPYQSVTGTGTPEGATVSGLCQGDGTWSYSYLCPDKKAMTCEGGSKVFYSPTGAVACTCSFDQAPIGGSRTGTCTSGGTLSGTCTSSGWAYTSNCPDPAKVSCPGGAVTLKSASNSSKTCYCAWNSLPAGSKSAASCSNGGSLSATCGGDGRWGGDVYSCP